jgi:hypothetical protein
MIEDSEGQMVSPKVIGQSNAVEGYDQTPISEWGVSDDEEDSVPISQLLVADKERIPILFEKGHSNLGRACAKFFEAVLHYGEVTEVIPRRNGYYYKITYMDGDQEDMDQEELIFAIQLKHKKDLGEEVHNEAEVLSGLSEEGSAYDSEEDRRALKDARKKRKIDTTVQKRKAVVASAKSGAKKKRSNAKKWTVCPESVANVGGPDSMLGKSMSRFEIY